MICEICGIEFIKTGNRQKYCSKECYNKKFNKKYQKEYYQDNKEQFKEQAKEYSQNHKEERKEYDKEYSKTPKGKEIIKRAMAKRKRNLGFKPLNGWFENSEGHHINRNDVIYIPKNYHFKGHSVTKNINMEPINTVAHFFLVMQNIDRFIL